MKGKIAIVSGGRHSILTAMQLNEAYQQGRADAIDECIKILAESEETILSDRQYYTLMELKEQK